MKSSPAFQFYPADFLADETVALMPLAARGAYITLLCYCWREGSIPTDMNRLGRLCGIDGSAMAQLWEDIYKCFELINPKQIADAESVTGNKPKHNTEDSSAINSYIANAELANSRYMHLGLERERIKQREFNRERQESGRRGAESRWQKAKTVQVVDAERVTENTEDSSAIPQPIATAIPQLLAVDASSSSSSSSNTEEERSHSLRSRSRRSSVCDEDYLEELQRNPAYQALNVRALFHKMVAWCEVKRKQPTRARLVNWLNREDPPMNTNGATPVSGRETYTHYADGREKPAHIKGFVI